MLLQLLVYGIIAVMKWKIPPIIKIYEAFGAIADGRVKIDGNKAIVKSSSGNKDYSVVFDSDKNAISANDNGSYWQGYLGYPSIAYLIETSVIKCKLDIVNVFMGIAWKDVNTTLKNDYEKVIDSVFTKISSECGTEMVANAKHEAELVLSQIKSLELNKIKTGIKPPKAC